MVILITCLILLELAVFGTGQRGRTVLLFQNEKFVKNRCSASRTYWICSKKVSLTTRLIIELRFCVREIN